MPNALLLLISIIEPLELGFGILRISMETETWEAQLPALQSVRELSAHLASGMLHAGAEERL